jgi:hypothetical protein
VPAPIAANQPPSAQLEEVAAAPRMAIGGRSDLSGLNAIMFVILVVVAFLAGAFLLFNFIAIGAGPPTPPPSLSAALPTVQPTAVLASETPGFSGLPGQTILPSQTALVLPGEPVNVTVDNNVVGSVTVTELRWPAQIRGNDPPSGSLWLTADVTYDANEGDIEYSSADWTLVDASHVVIEPSSTQRVPELGSGTLTDGNKKQGFITFLVPQNTTVVLHFASGGSTADFKVKPK